MLKMELADSLDVIISVAFIRGIVMTELSKSGKDWNIQSDLDLVKVVVSAVVPTTGHQIDGFLVSLPLDNPKMEGDISKYNAIFPLRTNDPATQTRLVIPGLIKREADSSDFDDGQYKRQSIDLLLTLMFGSEAITLGKTTIVVTGEELKTKQFDLHVHTEKKAVNNVQKKVTFPMRRVNSLSSLKSGDIAPASFKLDRKKRKWHIEKDAVIRVFMKVVVPSNQQHKHAFSVSQGCAGSVCGSRREVPMTIISNMAYYDQDVGSYRESQRDFGYYPNSGIVRSSSNLRPRSGSFHMISPFDGIPNNPIGRGRTVGLSDAAPLPIYRTGSELKKLRSSSVPRSSERSNRVMNSQGSAYGGSVYGHNAEGYHRRGQDVETDRYGGSMYGSSQRKSIPPKASYGGDYGGSSFQRAGQSSRKGMQSPYISTRNY